MSAGDLSVGQAGGVGRPAPSATRSPRDPTAMPTLPRAIPWADLLAAPITARSKMRNIKTRQRGSRSQRGDCFVGTLAGASGDCAGCIDSIGAQWFALRLSRRLCVAPIETIFRLFSDF